MEQFVAVDMVFAADDRAALPLFRPAEELRLTDHPNLSGPRTTAKFSAWGHLKKYPTQLEEVHI